MKVINLYSRARYDSDNVINDVKGENDSTGTQFSEIIQNSALLSRN